MDFVTLLITSLSVVALIAIFVIWNAQFLGREAAYYKRLWQQAAEDTGIFKAQAASLEIDNKQLNEKVTSWQNVWDFAADYIKQGGAILAVTTIRKYPAYLSTSTQENELHRGSKKNIFLPVPLPTNKQQNGVSESVEYVPVLVLTSKKDDTDVDSFHLVVLQPQDAVSQIMLKQYQSPVFMARIRVNIDRGHKRPTEKRYHLDIDTLAGTSRGANSLALDQLLARAKKERVQQISGTLTQSIIYENHRARLYYFYIKKYEFLYDAESNIISKTLLEKSSDLENS